MWDLGEDVDASMVFGVNSSVIPPRAVPQTRPLSAVQTAVCGNVFDVFLLSVWLGEKRGEQRQRALHDTPGKQRLNSSCNPEVDVF